MGVEKQCISNSFDGVEKVVLPGIVLDVISQLVDTLLMELIYTEQKYKRHVKCWCHVS